MKVAFVGVKRDYSKLDKNYVRFFNKYHLEIPFYYAELGGMDVTVTTTNYTGVHEDFPSGGRFWNEPELSWLGGHEKGRHEVVVHWRDWFEDLYDKKAYNVLHTCDHTYSDEWKQKVRAAVTAGKLKAIICYRGWHAENMARELSQDGHRLLEIPKLQIITDLTFGVDPTIYTPAPNKDRRALLWSSDPGRGLMGAVQLAIQLHQRDKRFKLHICHPDYVKPNPIQHPAIVWHGNVPNGPELWKIFNETGVLLYTSTFREPSSRACRQAQAAGSLVCYPPNMGTPSEYIQDMDTGIMRNIPRWSETLLNVLDSPDYDRICNLARKQALSESWEVQAKRFRSKMQELLGGRQ